MEAKQARISLSLISREYLGPERATSTIFHSSLPYKAQTVQVAVRYR